MYIYPIHHNLNLLRQTDYYCTCQTVPDLKNELASQYNLLATTHHLLVLIPFERLRARSYVPILSSVLKSLRCREQLALLRYPSNALPDRFFGNIRTRSCEYKRKAVSIDTLQWV